MSRIKAHGSKPEARLYGLVRQFLGHRWRIDRNVEDLPGRPDLVVPTLRLVIFMDGCFFHRCPKHGRVPDSNRGYWESKLRRNVDRDHLTRLELRRRGYVVWALWEHDLKPSKLPRTARTIERGLSRHIRRWRTEKELGSDRQA